MATMRTMQAAGIAVLALSLYAAPALAAPVAQGPVALHEDRDIVVEVGPHEADIVDPAVALADGYRTLFVNRCVGGLTITRGYNDSRSNTSSIIDQTRVFAAYPYGDTSWNQVMFELRRILAPFAIEVTDVDPGDQPHTEIVTCGQSFRGQNVLGVAPFGCGIVKNAIGYAFAENHPNDPRMLAETIAHEAGHTFSLNHLYDCEDPMTYLTGCGEKYFVDADLQCAGVAGGPSSWEPEACSCGGNTQNAFGTLMSIFGPAESTPPELAITAPLAGARVEPGFPVRVSADDLNGLSDVKLFIDEVFISSVDSRPFVFNAPMALSDGNHLVAVEASDTLGAVSRLELEVCVGADCVDTSVQPGAVGATCQSGADCQSQLCAQGADQISMCTEACSAESSCPEGFSCTAAGDSDVCWPTAPATGGCSTSGSGSGAWSMLGLAALLFLGRRRRDLVSGTSERRF